MKRVHLGLGMLYLGLGVGVDYPFAAFLSVLVLSLWWVGLLRVRFRQLLVVVVLAVGIPFVLRQVQVIAVLGFYFWRMDVWYSLLRRMPLASFLGPIPDSLELSRWYLERNVLKWPGGGGPVSLLTWAFVLIRAHAATLGLPSLVLALLGVYAGWIRHRVSGPMRSGLSLLVALGLATVATMLLFGEYVSVFYGALLMPMAVHWIIVLLGLTSYMLVAHRRRKISLRFRKRTWALPVGAMLLTAFVLWRTGTEVRNMVVLPPVGYPGREALAELTGHSVATLWISSAPSAYTDQWAATLQTVRWLVKSPHRFDFTPAEDYYTFFEVDRDNPRYRHPDFLLIPRLHIWGLTLTCQRFSGWVLAFADGCASLEVPKRQLAGLPLYREGPDFLLYDLREVRR